MFINKNMSKKRKGKSIANRSEKKSKTESKKRKITRKKVNTLSDGTIETIYSEEKQEEKCERTMEIFQSVTESFCEHIEQQFKHMIECSPNDIIQNNKYLTWRLEQIINVCRKANMLPFNSKSMRELFISLPSNLTTEFLVQYSWDDAFKFALVASEYRDKDILKNEFLNDFISSLFIDKILYSHFSETKIIVPKLMTKFGKITEECRDKNTTCKMISNMTFCFPFSNELGYISGFSFTPDFLPFDILRLSDYKNDFKHHLTNVKNNHIATLEDNIQVQLQASKLIKNI
jgi:hypothetical protein